MKFFTSLSYSPGEAFLKELRARMSGYKVVHLRDVPDDCNYSSLYFQVASSLGNFFYKNENPVTAELDTDGWLDMRYDATLADTHVYRHGNGRFPLHIDGVYSEVPFDVLFFYCEQSAEYGGATTFIDGVDVVEYLSKYDNALLEEILTTKVLFEKGNKSKLSPIIFYENGLPAFNWNLPRVAPSNSSKVQELVKRFDEFCETRLVQGGLPTPCRLAPGEAVFFHNRLILHGRNSFWGNRCLMKGRDRTQH
jgi:alpha-ketoglutarate-dependent taurine dioxygenase